MVGRRDRRALPYIHDEMKGLFWRAEVWANIRLFTLIYEYMSEFVPKPHVAHCIPGSREKF